MLNKFPNVFENQWLKRIDWLWSTKIFPNFQTLSKHLVLPFDAEKWEIEGNRQMWLLFAEFICRINSRKMWLNFHLFGLYSEKTLKDTIWFRKVINFRELLLFSTQWSLSLSVLVRWRPNILTIHHFLLVLIPFLNLHSQFNYSFGPKLSLRIV